MIYELIPTGSAGEFLDLAARLQVTRVGLLLCDALGRDALGEGAVRAHVEEAFNVLNTYDSPDVPPADRVIALPQFNIFVSRWAELGDAAAADYPYHLGEFAAAAAIERSASAFEVTVPTHRGGVHLPTIGWVALEAPGPRAVVSASPDGGLRVRDSAGGRSVPIPVDQPASQTWRPARWLEAASDGQNLRVHFDDGYPLSRNQYGALDASPVSDADFAKWQAAFVGGWEILVQEFPHYAQDIAKIMRCIVPLADMPPGQGRSATNRYMPGAVGMSRPLTADNFAETLVHEAAGHDRLNRLLGMVRLLGRDDSEELQYAPWRDDPRPAGALVHGAFAHLLVADYRRGRMRYVTNDPALSLLSQVEYVRWREQVQRTAETLERTGCLTPAGEVFLGRLRQRLDAWDDVVSLEARQLADFAVRDHELSWRLHNLELDAGGLGRLAGHYQDGLPAPAVVGLGAAIRRDNRDFTQIGRRNREILARRRVRDPAAFMRMHENEAALHELLPAANLADAWLVGGDSSRARGRYVELIAANPHNLDAWSGLAMTYFNTDSPRARILQENPEVLAQLYHRLPEKPDPLDLADWLAKSSLEIVTT